jgi:hypothetical protein
VSRTYALDAALSTGTNRQVIEALTVTVPDSGTGHTQAVLGVLSETVAVAQFADVTANGVGTYQMLGSIPAGALILLTKVGPVVGFAGDTTAALTVGDGSDPDRYNTGTIDCLYDGRGGRAGGHSLRHQAGDDCQPADAHDHEQRGFHVRRNRWSRRGHGVHLLPPGRVR